MMDFKRKVILAPMAGVNDTAFRQMCKSYGADIVYTDMMSANAIVRNNKSTLSLAKHDKKEKPIIMQIFGHNIEYLTKSSQVLESLGASAIDLNLGCPDTRVIGQGSGSALLKRPQRIFDIIKAMKHAVAIPVTAKIRLGITDKKDLVKNCKLIEKAGADAIIVHGRTVKEGYSGKCDLDSIKLAKESVRIPVIGNGDIFTFNDAKNMFDYTKCDSIMIGRGALGNPFFFKQVREFLDNNKIIPSQTKEEKIRDFLHYFELYSSCNEKVNLARIKTQAMYFLSCFDGSVKMRNTISRLKSCEEIVKYLNGPVRI